MFYTDANKISGLTREAQLNEYLREGEDEQQEKLAEKEADFRYREWKEEKDV